MQDLLGIKKAVNTEIPKLAASLTSAFYDDPVMSWCIRQDKKRSKALELCFEYLLKDSIIYDEVICTTELDACAMWLPPGKWLSAPSIREIFDMLPGLIQWMGISRVNRWITMLTTEAKYRPKNPHFYLAFLGVSKDRQGQGIGSSLLNYTLKKLDENELSAYLESSNILNNVFYEKHGFRVINEIQLHNGPKMWSMWREPI